ncbi:MAG: SGNH/GDSL hydrolase family protein [Nannocystis sp.]|uniref:SGNH/GDSL hydrolase family protein n=1 Tax=Nannocystis sp. TaxID=1962667 RepID=UPI00242844B9|nr:GDSL-type esterase/lipase family protein [Nannocystis sp.]MBK9758115.1 SGNH/GDSL hydrolase family protein [Nannocystis sp.]
MYISNPEPSSTTKRPRRPWALAWTLVWLIGVEAAARLLWTPAQVGPELYARVEPSFDYGFDFTRPQCEPDDEAKITCWPTQYRPIFKQSFDRIKRPNTIRAFTFGGSHAAGAGGYTGALVRLLRRTCGARRWEGINLAVKGQGSTRALVALKDALRHEPDLVILDFGGTNEYEDERDLNRRAQLHTSIWKFVLTSRAVVIGRKLLALHFELMRVPRMTGEGEQVASRNPENLARWERSLADNFREMIALTHGRGIPVVIVGRASRNAHAPRSRDLASHRLFLSLASDGVLLFDAHAAFQAVDRASRKALFRGNGDHYSRKGHELIAQGLAALLLRELPAARVCDPR